MSTTRHGLGLEVVIALAIGAAPLYAAPPSRALERDPSAARDLGTLATQALDEHEPELAARRFEAAYELDPHPVWQVGAATAWLDAAEPTRAKERLESALEDPRMNPSTEKAARRLLDVARELAPKVAEATRATRAGEHVQAGRSWEDAFALRPRGRYLVMALRAAERAGALRDMRRLAAEASARDDLGADERRWVNDLRSRLGATDALAVKVPAPPADPVGPWVLIGAGGAVILGGVAALLVAEDANADVRAMKAGAVDGVVLGPTRADAAARADDARTWSRVGWVGVGVGAVAAALGTGWLAARTPSLGEGRVDDPSVSWGLTPVHAGWAVTAQGGF